MVNVDLVFPVLSGGDFLSCKLSWKMSVESGPTVLPNRQIPSAKENGGASPGPWGPNICAEGQKFVWSEKKPGPGHVQKTSEF